MNKTLWKLQNAGERLWLLANMTAQQAAALEIEGRGIAVVADETRKIANRIQELVERALFEEEEIQPDTVRDIAFYLNILALNSAIESSRIGWRGKPTVVCVEDIRILANEISLLIDGNDSKHETMIPLPKDCLTSVKQGEFMLLHMAGVYAAEPLANIKEICIDAERAGNRLKIRGMELPLIDSLSMLGKPNEASCYVVLHTPWAKQNKTYAVTANVSCLFFSPIGKPISAPPGAPLAGYIREYWESENDIPFLFMDLPKMV